MGHNIYVLMENKLKIIPKSSPLPLLIGSLSQMQNFIT